MRKKSPLSPAPVPEELPGLPESRPSARSDFIDRVATSAAKAELARELSQLRGRGPAEVSTLHVVVFGTVSAGKTSLINALLGRDVGETEAVMGTTRHGESHTYELKAVDATVCLTDTPGLSEAGEAGEAREIEARAWPSAPTCCCSWSITT